MANQRRPKGDGSIYKTTDSSGRVSWVGDIKLGGKRRRVKAPTKSEAADKLRKLIENHKSGVTAPAPAKESKSTTVGEILEVWLAKGFTETRKGKADKGGTRINHEWAVGRLLSAICEPDEPNGLPVKLRDIPGEDLTALQVNQALRFIARSPLPKREGGKPPRPALTSQSLKKIRSVLGAAFDYAKYKEKIEKNVLNTVRDAPIPDNAVEDGKGGALKRDAALRLADGLRDHPDGAMFYLMLRMGLRSGEAIGLPVDAYDGENLSIWQAARPTHEKIRIKKDEAAKPVDETKKKPEKSKQRVEVVDQLKNSASRRTLALPADVVDVLNRHLDREAERLSRPSKGRGRTLMFVGPTGDIVDSKAAREQLKAFCETFNAYVEVDGVSRPANPHELRHTAATMMVNSGATPLEVALVLGHQDTKMVFARYFHKDEQSPRTAAIKNDWLLTK